jgi:phosphatidylinositol alpha-mannosyltransferase
MRILQVSPYAMERKGGVQTHVRDVARWLSDAGHDVTIIAPGPGRGDAAILPLGRHLNIDLSGTRFEVTWVGRRELDAAVRTAVASTIDVVHLHTPFVPALPVRVWRAFRRPTVVTFHATLPPQDRLLRALLRPVARAMSRHAAATIAVSPSAAELLQPVDPRRPIDLLPPTIDLSAWRAAGAAAVGRRDPAPSVRILFLGRFEARKGLDVLIAAWPEIVRGCPSVPLELVIAGAGELAPLAEDLAKRDPGRVSIVAGPDDATARRLVAEADLMVAPAPWGESFGLVLVEALAAGTPVVAAANPGYAGVLTGPGEALLVPPGDPRALARRVVELLTDPDRLDALRAWGGAHVEQFDVAAVGPKILDIYRRVAPDA